MIQYEFRMYESRVRNVVVELKKVIEAGREGGFLRDEPIDLSGEPRQRGQLADPDRGAALDLLRIHR
jgi:hypothetical protein